MARRHGALLRSGEEMLPDEAILCATSWMHGVFGAQLTVGNTSFHKLFSVSRDPYNITRGSGLRMLVETNDGWRLLTVPSAFEMGLSDCRWIYRSVTESSRSALPLPATNPPCSGAYPLKASLAGFLLSAIWSSASRNSRTPVELRSNSQRKRFTFRPDPDDRWGQQYPQAVYHLVTSTPDQVEAIGGDELLYSDGKRRSCAFAAIRTRPTNEFVFAVVGSTTDAERAEALASKYAEPVVEVSMLARSDRFWRNVSRAHSHQER